LPDTVLAVEAMAGAGLITVQAIGMAVNKCSLFRYLCAGSSRFTTLHGLTMMPDMVCHAGMPGPMKRLSI